MTGVVVSEYARLANLRVLVVEDDPDVAQSLELLLQLVNCKVDIAADGSAAIERAVNGRYDIIVLDLNLPSPDGLSVCRTVRKQQVSTPILVLSARASEGDKVIGLDAGADDYMTKPFSPLELRARLSALMRRGSGHLETAAVTRLMSGELVIEVDQRAVTLRGRAVGLTAREFDLLLTLARHPGRVYTREQLLDAVWGYTHDGYGHTVNSHVNRLRAKIEAVPNKPQYVLTVWSVGYKFADGRTAV